MIFRGLTRCCALHKVIQRVFIINSYRRLYHFSSPSLETLHHWTPFVVLRHVYFLLEHCLGTHSVYAPFASISTAFYFQIHLEWILSLILYYPLNVNVGGIEIECRDLMIWSVMWDARRLGARMLRVTSFYFKLVQSGNVIIWRNIFLSHLPRNFQSFPLYHVVVSLWNWLQIWGFHSILFIHRQRQPPNYKFQTISSYKLLVRRQRWFQIQRIESNRSSPKRQWTGHSVDDFMSRFQWKRFECISIVNRLGIDMDRFCR